MSGLREKLGIKVAVILLFSVFILTGLTVTQAHGQPLDSPLYSNTNTKAVEAMNAPADTNLAGGPGASLLPRTCTGYVKPCACVPVMSAAGEIVFILTLTGGACWAILRKKSS
jgi:hypothetical protein